MSRRARRLGSLGSLGSVGSVVSAALVMTLAPDARARPFDRWQGGAWLHYELTALHAVDDARVTAEHPRATELVLAAARLHGFVGQGRTIGFHIGIDLGAGATLRGGGLAYDVALFPVGIGVRVGRTGIVALGAGVGAIGAVGTLDDAVTLPLEVNVELGGGRARLLARGRVAYVAGAAGRQSAAPSAPFADELDATIGLRLGRHYEDFGFPSGNGYFVGASYRELAGTRFCGLVIGYSIDLATAPRAAAPRSEALRDL